MATSLIRPIPSKATPLFNRPEILQKQKRGYLLIRLKTFISAISGLLERGVAFDGIGLIREVAIGGIGLIRRGSL
jgi:hypothetical protein